MATIIEVTQKTMGLHVFSGGEVNMNMSLGTTRGTPMRNNHFVIKCLDYTMNGFMQVALINEVLRRNQAASIKLFYPYFPYARQDRVMRNEEAFSLKVFTDMVNALKFDEVIICDPHSDVTPALINNCRVIPQEVLAQRAFITKNYLADDSILFVAPDAGAFKKVSKLMPDDKRIIIGTKNRDTSTGKITGTSVLSNVHMAGRTCVIVDDICDGGRTFIELAKVLKQKHEVERVVLYVTHGIFSQGLAPILEHIDFIHTTDSFPYPTTDEWQGRIIYHSLRFVL